MALIFVLSLNLISLTAIGVSDIESNKSINNGINWLINQQADKGSWGDYYPVGVTGFAVVALEDRTNQLGYKSIFISPYGATIQKGLNYLFSNAHNIDTDKNGVNDAIYFGSPGQDHAVYETGIAMMAIAASREPDAIVNVNSSDIIGRSYRDVEERSLNYLKSIQTGAGGWDYGHLHSAAPADNSNTGFAILGIAYASDKFGIAVPDKIKAGLDAWINHIQCSQAGGAGYRDACDGYLSILETGNLLYEIAMVGNPSDPRREKAIEFAQSHWNDTNWKPGWKGPGPTGESWSNYQATYIGMKGLEGSNIKTINLQGKQIDWFDEMASKIVMEQSSDGSWNETWQADNSKVPKLIATEWAILTLEKSVPVISPPKENITGGCCPPVIIVVNINYPKGSSIGGK